MIRKILVAYICSPYVDEKIFFKFIKNYKTYTPGIKHKLLICFKNLAKDKIKYFKSRLANLNYIAFQDRRHRNDWDFMSFYRIAKKYKDYLIFFFK
jgi:hypothetical protein